MLRLCPSLSTLRVPSAQCRLHLVLGSVVALACSKPATSTPEASLRDAARTNDAGLTTAHHRDASARASTATDDTAQEPGSAGPSASTSPAPPVGSETWVATDTATGPTGTDSALPDEGTRSAGTQSSELATSSVASSTVDMTSEPTCDPNASLDCPCPEGQLRCYGVCTDPLINANYCGASEGCELTTSPGTACQPLNAICDGGECMPCESPFVACGNRCIDPSRDQQYCGAAPGCSPQETTRGDRCWNPELCLAGLCVECVVFTARSGSVPDHAGQLALEEVTGDDLPDVVTVSGDPAAIVIVPGATGQNVAEAVSLPFGQAPSALGLGRIDGDDALDVLVGDDAAGTVQVALGDGVGNFAPGASYEVPGRPRQILLGDFNGDQDLDALVVSRDLSQVSFLLGNGDGTFESVAPAAGEKLLSAAALGDINGDGALDAVVVGLANVVMILMGNGDGSFAASSHPSDGYGSTVALADLDGDQHLDLIVTPTLSGYNVEVSIGNGDGTFQDRHRLNASFSTDAVDGTPQALAIADYDGDSQPDIVVGMNSGLTILWGHQNWGADYRRAVTEYSEFIGLLAGDINGDGVLDILASLYNTNQDFRVYYGSVPAECPALETR